MASCQELLDSIRPGMKLTKDLFMKIYGYELTWPGFARNALVRLEESGCSRAREYYKHFVAEYEDKHREEMKRVAGWYRKYIKERSEQLRRKQQEVEPQKAVLRQKSDRELLILLQKLKTENAL